MNINSSEKSIHIRRCHICGEVNEVESALVDRCTSCGKFLAPFVFFDEKAALGIEPERKDDISSVISNRLRSNDHLTLLKSKYPPIWGITVYW